MKTRKWIQPPLMLCRTVSLLQWLLNLTVIFIGGVVMLYVGSHWGKWDPGFWQEGLGEPNPSLLIPATLGWPLMATIILANVPQLAISVAYFSLNSVLTTMLVCKELSQDAASERSDIAVESARTSVNEGHPLRVSEPVKRSEQVGNWQLSLPYAYAIPLTGAMMLLHWFASQAIFAVRVGSYNLDGDPPRYSSGCGWSIKGIIASVAVGGAMIVALGAVAAFGRLKKGIPTIGSCSVALAAACHGRLADVGAELKMVSYGVLEEVYVDGKNIGRVGFGSNGVRALKEGDVYV